MMLLTKEIRKSLPPLYSQDGKGDDAIAYVKFFTPWSQWTWYATEASATLADGTEVSLTEADKSGATVEDVTFYGLVFGFEKEFGPFSLAELEAVKGPFGLKVERDLHFTPTRVADLKDPCGLLK